ncbi:MAG: cytochrome C, partial [Maribacter sp.]|nr:cytochrome C [Maribacter sp.]
MTIASRLRYTILYISIVLGVIQCEDAPRDGGLFLPVDFAATVFIDSIEETVRHMAVTDDGTLYAKLRNAGEKGTMAILRDTDNDGNSDAIQRFGSINKRQRWSYATALRVYNGYIYFSSDLVVYRYKLNPNTLGPEGE